MLSGAVVPARTALRVQCIHSALLERGGDERLDRLGLLVGVDRGIESLGLRSTGAKKGAVRERRVREGKTGEDREEREREGRLQGRCGQMTGRCRLDRRCRADLTGVSRRLRTCLE